MRRSFLFLTTALVLSLAGTAGACMGDVWVDSRMGEINDYGVRYREPFVNEMVTYYGAPRPVVVDLLETRHWSAGDVYYACALAHSAGRPCAEVADRYEHNRGGGWGVVAESYGIHPGSPQFLAFKNSFVGTYGRWGHPIVIDRDEHVRWTERSMRVSREVVYSHGHGHAYGRYKHDFEGDDHGNGHDKHGDEGDDHDNGHGHKHK